MAADDGDSVELVLGSWRTEDIAMWEDEIIPAFEESHPGIKVEFAATDTNDYNAAIQSQVEGGNAPDLITCRPFDVNRAWIADGYFDDLTGLDGDRRVRRDRARRLDRTRTARPTACPSPPCSPASTTTRRSSTSSASRFRRRRPSSSTCCRRSRMTARTRRSPSAPADGWQLAYNVLYNIGPNYWKGEEGRLGLIDGTKKLTDPDFVAAFEAVDELKPFLPNGYEAITYDDMGQLFNLGQAAIIPDGSWNINQLTSTGLDVGVFGAPVPAAGDQRYQQEMPDMAYRPQRREREEGCREGVPRVDLARPSSCSST